VDHTWQPADLIEDRLERVPPDVLTREREGVVGPADVLCEHDPRDFPKPAGDPAVLAVCTSTYAVMTSSSFSAVLPSSGWPCPIGLTYELRAIGNPRDCSVAKSMLCPWIRR
jgi:hypothetical protein